MRRALPSLLLASVLSLAAPCLAGQDVARPLAEWKGEYFVKKQGGVYVKMALKNLRASTANVQVILGNILTKKTYVLSHEPGDGDGYPRDLRKLDAGKYEILQIVMVDAAGGKRIWRGDDDARKKTIVVRRQCLSNLGLWTLAPEGRDGLAVTFSMAPNSYKEVGAAADSSVAAVLNGFNGNIQETIGGKKVLEASGSDYATQKQLRATVTLTRQIAMFFKLDLMKHNQYAKSIANVLSVYDPNMRKCYTDRLEENETLRGDVQFTFLLAKRTGTMAKLKNTGGSLADPKLAACLYDELAQIQFPVPENMVGVVTFSFDVQ